MSVRATCGKCGRTVWPTGSMIATWTDREDGADALGSGSVCPAVGDFTTHTVDGSPHPQIRECGLCGRVAPVATWCFEQPQIGPGEYPVCHKCAADLAAETEE